MENQQQFDPWGGGPHRGAFLSPVEQADPVLTAAALKDPEREWVMVCPAWFFGVSEVLSALCDDVSAGRATPEGILGALSGMAADIMALAAGYPGALDADLADPGFPPHIVEFLAMVQGEPTELLPGWGDVVASALGEG